MFSRVFSANLVDLVKYARITITHVNFIALTLAQYLPSPLGDV